jgi:hypothetical protein
VGDVRYRYDSGKEALQYKDDGPRFLNTAAKRLVIVEYLILSLTESGNHDLPGWIAYAFSLIISTCADDIREMVSRFTLSSGVRSLSFSRTKAATST